MEFNNKAFTLLEILVVVLIIGILAAIAVPQYQKSVAKAELGQIISMTRTIKEAEEFYYLSNGQYAPINSLDISVHNPDVECQLHNQNYFSCYGKNFGILYYFRNSTHPQYTECYINSRDENSYLAFACKDFLKNQGNPHNSPWGRDTRHFSGGYQLIFHGTANF